MICVPTWPIRPNWIATRVRSNQVMPLVVFSTPITVAASDEIRLLAVLDRVDSHAVQRVAEQPAEVLEKDLQQRKRREHHGLIGDLYRLCLFLDGDRLGAVGDRAFFDRRGLVRVRQSCVRQIDLRNDSLRLRTGISRMIRSG
jgi:hypothetical protein